MVPPFIDRDNFTRFTLQSGRGSPKKHAETTVVLSAVFGRSSIVCRVSISPRESNSGRASGVCKKSVLRFWKVGYRPSAQLRSKNSQPISDAQTSTFPHTNQSATATGEQIATNHSRVFLNQSETPNMISVPHMNQSARATSE